MCYQQSLRPACAYSEPDQSLCYLLEYSTIVQLLTEHHLEFLRLNGGCRGSPESTHVKLLEISCRGSLIIASSCDFHYCTEGSDELAHMQYRKGLHQQYRHKVETHPVSKIWPLSAQFYKLTGGVDDDSGP